MYGWATDISDVGKIIRTTDGGMTWTVSSGWSAYLLFSVDFVNENTGYCVGMFGAIIKTTNGGNTWVTQPDPPPHDWLYGVHFLNEETGWVVGFNGKVIFTTDGGSNWSQQTSGTTAQLNSVYFFNQTLGWAAGEDPLTYGGIIINYSTLVTSVQNDKEYTVPTEFSLSQNYPNPFNPSTTIQYSIPESGNVRLKIFNTLGEEVAELVNEYQQANTYMVNFNGENLSSGIYFYQIRAGEYTETKKMVIIK